jgi:hypothetical protein
MMPSSVKKDRSLLTRICSRAVVITSVKRITIISNRGHAGAMLKTALKTTGKGPGVVS